MFMLKQKGKLAAIAACCVVSFATSARAEIAPQSRSQFGASAEGRKADREIVITPNVRTVSVTAGEVIHFVVPGGAAFTWNFDTWGGRTAQLDRIAPGMVAQPVRIYIADDPRYGGA